MESETVAETPAEALGNEFLKWYLTARDCALGCRTPKYGWRLLDEDSILERRCRECGNIQRFHVATLKGNISRRDAAP
jgi:hypothetical protein